MSDFYNQDITYIGETDFRNSRTRFGIKNVDRARHMYVIGKTGMGKSTLLENMAAQDIANGHGLCFIDPHGSSAELLLEYVPEHRIDDVMYFAPFDTEHPISFNPLEDVDSDNRHLVASGLMSAFKKIWVDAFSARMEYILSNAILALLEYPESTLLSVNRMLVEKEFRKKVVDNITDPTVRAFWVEEYEKWDDRYRKEAGAAIQNKVGQFVSNPLIRNIVGQPKSSFDLREMMDGKKILLVNLSKGQIGEQNAGLLGGMFITKLYLAAMSRADLDKNQLAELPSFYFYVDEFQSFANESFADILSEARKYKLALTVAHQYVAQMPDEVREAVFGNVGSMVVFRVGPGDAEHFEREFAPVFTEQDIVNIGRFQFYLRLMIDGMGSSPFSSVGMPPLEKPATSNKQAVVEMSRQKYADSRAVVDKRISEWYTPIPSQKDIEHKEYIEKKKAEFKAQGKEWVDFSKNPEKKKEYEAKKGGPQKPKGKKDFKKPAYPKPSRDIQKPKTTNKNILSPKLQGLLDSLEDGTGTQKPQQKKEKSVSLEKLTPPKKKSFDRKASSEKVSSLKDALLKAGIGGAISSEKPEKKEVPKKKEKTAPVINRVAPKEVEEKRQEQRPEPEVKKEEPLLGIRLDIKMPESESQPQEKKEVKEAPLVENKTILKEEVVLPQGEKTPEVSQSEPSKEKDDTNFSEERPQTNSSSEGKYSPDELLEALLNN